MKIYAPTKLTENIRETPEGYLHCIGVSIGRVGVMIYGAGETPLTPGPDGKVKITRSEKELFRPETIASFEGKSFTVKHPEEFVGPENWKELTGGILQNVHRGEGEAKDDLVCDILVTDKKAIELVKAGLREVSCGYEAEYVQTGEGTGEQLNIVGNHCALVEEGRAGPSYAINDHKGKGLAMSKKISEKLKTLFARTADEVAKVVDESEEGDKEKEKEKSKDEMGTGYDELISMVKDLGEKVAALAGGEKSKDADPAAKKKEDESKDADKDADKEEKSKDAGSLEERLAALEAMVAKIMKGESDEETGDEEGDEDEEAEDDDVEESVLTGDSAEIAARAEILSPGIKVTKDVKTASLKAAYGTDEGKKVIEKLTGGKAPTFDSAEKVDTLFVAASELMKATRMSGFSKSKQTRDFNSAYETEGVMTPEKMNEINAAKYKLN